MRTMARPVFPEPVMPTIEAVGQAGRRVELESRPSFRFRGRSAFRGRAVAHARLLSSLPRLARAPSRRGTLSAKPVLPRRSQAAQVLDGGRRPASALSPDLAISHFPRSAPARLLLLPG